MADTATLTTSNTPRETQKSPFSPVPKKPELTMEQKVFGGFGWDTSEFLDNSRIQSNKGYIDNQIQKVQASGVQGELVFKPSSTTSGPDIKQATTEAVQDLAKTSVKVVENVGSIAGDVAGETAAIFKFIATGNPEILYSTPEQSKAPSNNQSPEAQKEQVEKVQTFELKRQSEQVIENSIKQVSLNKLAEETLRILQNGAGVTSEQMRKRLGLQEGYEGEITIYHKVELRAAQSEDQQVAQRAETSQSIAETSDSTTIHIGNFEGGNVKGSAANVSQTGGGGAG